MSGFHLNSLGPRFKGKGGIEKPDKDLALVDDDVVFVVPDNDVIVVVMVLGRCCCYFLQVWKSSVVKAEVNWA